MPKIYDNIEQHLNKGLNETLEHSQRADFCVGFFYLSGWKEVSARIDNLVASDLKCSKDSADEILGFYIQLQRSLFA